MSNGEIKIIRASAGSGKTYTLARTYITNLIGVKEDSNVGEEMYHLREGSDFYNHILAITFTNKATNEMKERIITQLYELGNGEGDYVDYFKEHFSNDFDSIKTAAKRALCSILFNYGSFNVSTIDSFFQKILRNFARELDRDYNYDIQLDENYATQVAVHDFLLELGGDRPGQTAIDEWVKAFILNNLSQNKSWNIFNNSSALESFAKIIYKEFFREHHDAIIEYLKDIGSGHSLSRIMRFKKALVECRNEQEKQLKECIFQYKPFFNKHGFPEEAIKKTGMVGKQFYNGDTNVKLDQANETLLKYASNKESLVDNILNKKYKDSASQSACEEFSQLASDTYYHWSMIPFLDSVINNIWNLGLLGRIDNKLEQYRKDTNSILIADTNDLIGKVLDCGATFIYERAGTHFFNYMIDEFQDTSRKQYQNFEPLLKESCSAGNNNLIIGDEKQSIYRFRNSDPSMLREELGEHFSYFAKNITLDTNYRSFPAIVNFNNLFFQTIISDFCLDDTTLSSLKKTYKNIKQEKHQKSKQGFVRFNIVEEQSDASELRQSILDALPDYINAIRSRGYAMKDIAILVNRNAEGNDVIEQILQYNQSLSDNDPRVINVVSNESLLLKNSPSIMLIISMLRFIDATQYKIEEENEGNEPLTSFLKLRLSRQKQYKVLNTFQGKLQKEADDATAGELLLESFKEDRAMNSKSQAEQLNYYSSVTQEVMPNKQTQLTNLTNIVDNIIKKYILPQANEVDGTTHLADNAFIMSFTSEVHDFVKHRNGGTIKEFLEYWDVEKEKLAVRSPSNTDAINVMTVHKSKGLEFKCVIIPFADWKLINEDSVFWIKQEEWLGNNSTGKPIAGIDDKEILPPLIPVSNTKKTKLTNFFAAQISEEQEKSLIDNLNKLYVAFTRPKDELHVFVPHKKEKTQSGQKEKTTKVQKEEAQPTSTSGLLIKYIPALSGDELSFSHAEEQLPCPMNGDGDTPMTLKVTTYHAGRPTSLEENELEREKETRKKSKKKSINTATMTDYKVLDRLMPVHIKVDNGNIFINEGKRMHDILSHIKDLNDFDSAMKYAQDNLLFEGNRYWTRERLEKLLNTIKGNADYRSWFDEQNTVLNERTISHIGPNKDFEHLRPDRIVRRPDGEILVIDYKFGYKHDDDTVDADREKVAAYMSTLREMGFAQEKMRGYLWYARHNIVIPVE